MTERLRKIIRNLIIIVIAIGLFFSGYYVYNTYFVHEIPVENVLSDESPLILEIRNHSDLVNKLIAPDSLGFEYLSIIEDSGASAFFTQIGRALISDKDFKTAINQQKSFIFFEKTADTVCDVVFAISLKKKDAEKILDLLFVTDHQKQNWSNILHDFGGFKLTEFRNSKSRKSIFTNYRKGLLVLSPSRDALENALLRSENPIKKPNISSLKVIAGKDADINLYINFREFRMQNLIPGMGNFLSGKTKFGGPAVFDVKLNPVDVSMVGFTLPDHHGFLNVFSGQNPVKQEMWKILPESTRSVISMGFENSSLFAEKYSDGMSASPDILRSIPVIEAGKVLFGTMISQQFLFLRFSDKNEGLKLLSSYSIKGSNNLSAVSEGIGFLTFDSLSAQSPVLRSLAGDLKLNCCSVYQDYFIFGSDEAMVSIVMGQQKVGMLLSHKDWFKSFNNQITESANLSIFITPSCLDVKRNLKLSYPEQFLLRLLSDGKGSCLQVSGTENGFFTSFSFVFSDEKGHSNISDETIEKIDSLENKNLQSRILIPKGSAKTNICFFLVSSDFKLSAFDHNGQPIFSFPLEEDILSDIFIIEKPLRFLFNTQSQLFSLNSDGSVSKGFPENLLVKASNGIAVFDYDHKNSYRILYGGIDRRVYNLDVTGKSVAGFGTVIMPSEIKQSIKHVVAAGKDYLMVTDIDGHFRILSRKGEIRINTNKDLLIKPDAGFYESFDRKKGIIFTLSKNSSLLFIDLYGKTKDVKLKDITSIDHFKFFNFSGDNMNELMVVENSELHVFNHKLELIQSRNFNIDGFDRFFSRRSSNHEIIGLLSTKTGQLMLMDESGNNYSSPIYAVDDADFFMDSGNGRVKLVLLKNNNIEIAEMKSN